MVYRTLIQNLYTFQHQIECDSYWDSLAVANVSVCIPDPRHLQRKKLLYSQKRPRDTDEKVIALGSIYCYDALSLNLISNLAKESTTQSSSTSIQQ
ncbi:unnamed protein product [Absidia cylindrospora]